MPIHRAVGTSLLAIVLISISGVSSFLASGQSLSVGITMWFLVGGFLGMFIGGLVAKRLRGTVLQQIFAAAVVLVAAFVIVQSVLLST